MGLDTRTVKGRVIDVSFDRTVVDRTSTAIVENTTKMLSVVLDQPLNVGRDVWVSIGKPSLAALDEVRSLLYRHPAPWGLNYEMHDCKDGGRYAAVLDAYGREIFGTSDYEGYVSGFRGDVGVVVRLVNLIAEVLETKGEPEPKLIDPANVGRWAETNDGRVGIITRLEHWNEDGKEDCYLMLPGETLALKVTSDEVTVREDLPRAWEAENNE